MPLTTDRFDGSAAAFTGWKPGEARRSGRWLIWLASVIPPRVKDEEDMLRREFGKEWEVWASKTARFIPGIY